MDHRVAEFSRRFLSYRHAEFLPVHAIRDELLALHAKVEDEASRVELVRLFHILGELVAAHLQDTGGDLVGFSAFWQGQLWRLLRAECLAGGRLDIGRLRDATAREVAAGRLAEHDPIRRFALGDQRAFG